MHTILSKDKAIHGTVTNVWSRRNVHSLSLSASKSDDFQTIHSQPFGQLAYFSEISEDTETEECVERQDKREEQYSKVNQKYKLRQLLGLIYN